MAVLDVVTARQGRGSHVRAMIGKAPHLLLLLPTLAVIVGACGGLETPVGAVAGRIVGAATTGAYVYPLGRPDLKVDVQPDGSYRLEAVPIELRALVLYDGFPMPDGRAELVQVRLTGGTENRIPDRFGGAGGLMPIAGTVLAAAVPDGGATPWRPTFTLPATVHAGITPDTGGVREILAAPRRSVRRRSRPHRVRRRQDHGDRVRRDDLGRACAAPDRCRRDRAWLRLCPRHSRVRERARL